MRPQTNRPWRKTLRQEARGVKAGRRTTHLPSTQSPRPGSTWWRRHMWLPDREVAGP